MKMWRWILLAQLVVLPGLALVLWLGSADQPVNEGPEHQPAVADETQPIPTDPGELKQPVVVWTSKGSFDPMHVRNLDAVDPRRVRVAGISWAGTEGAEKGDELVAAINELWRAFKAGDKSAVDAILERERDVVRLGYEIVDVDETGVRLTARSGRSGRFNPDGEPVGNNGQVEPMPFGRHTFGPWDTGRAVELR
ncbi:MAG: hypothetical protein KF754_15015 [Planctomycetes bacterium]|nr:hypothetical protein [Planctomycetota bacterium]